MQLDRLARKSYGVGLKAILADKNKARRTTRLWALSGMFIKKDFSAETFGARRIAPGRYETKWVIDPKKLAALPETDWRLVAMHLSPRRRRTESAKAFTERLARETVIGRALKAMLHKYICANSETRKAVKEAIEAGIKFLTETLRDALPGEVRNGIGLFAILVANIGVDAICRSAARAVRA